MDKDRKFDAKNSFNLSDDLNEIINSKIEEEEANSIEEALNSEAQDEELDEISAQIDDEISKELSDIGGEKSKSKLEQKKKDANEEDKKKKKNIIIIILILILVILASILLGKYLYDRSNANKDFDEMEQILETTLEPVVLEDNLIQNPYDFESLTAQNADIYSWIVVPNTNVNYPIVQSASNDDFYLKHSALTKEWQSSGAIYTQRVNKKDYTDPLTILYGHNGYRDKNGEYSMFTNLHKFEKKDFFDANEYFYIYTDGQKLTYQIVSAFKFDDRHLMHAYKMQDLDSRASFMAMIQNPDSTNKNVRDIGRSLTTDDKICVLSTCITNQKSNRYLVCGVLVNNEKTN